MPNFENEFMKTIIANDSGLPSAIELQADGSSVLRTIDPTGETLGMADVFGGGIKPDIYALSEAAGAPVTEAEVAGTMGGVVPGAAIGAATAIPDIAALVKGGVQAATAEEGSRIEEFLKGFSSISGVIGSEKAFELYDAGVDMLPISDEAKQGLKQGALVGEVIGFGTGAKKGAEAVARTTLNNPTKKNPVTAIAPTETEPGIIAFHGSGKDFDEFKLEKVGTGVGHQGYGSGLYFSSSEELAKGYKGDAGKLFMVRLGVKESNLLDWQQPLKQQPEMLKKIRTLIDDKDILKSFDYNVEKGIIAGNAYSNYIGKTKEETSKLLKSVGIDGIKYLDIGSKGGGKTIADAPTNYVIFNDKAIKILDKYGIVGPVAITGVASAQQEGADDGNI